MKKFGFSLLEVVIALALSSMMGTLLFTTFFQSNRTLRTVNEFSELDMGIATILTQLERDCAGALVLEYEPGQKKENEQTKEEESRDQKTQDPKEQKKREPALIAKTKNKQLDFITFITTNPRSRYGAPLPNIAPKPSLVRVMYKLRENTEKKGAFLLLRQESTNLDRTSFEKKNENRPRELTISDAVQQCTIEFMYKSQEEKEKAEQPSPTPAPQKGTQEFKVATEWGAKEQTEQLPPLPAMIKIGLTLWDSQLQVTRSIEYLLPMYSVYVESEQKTSEGQRSSPRERDESAEGIPGAGRTPQRPTQSPFQFQQNFNLRGAQPPRTQGAPQKLSMGRRRRLHQFLGDAS